MHTELQRVHAAPDEHRYAHPHARGWILLLLGAGVVAAGIVAMDGVGGWLVAGLGALFLAGGVSSALYRMELTLDFSRGRYRYRRGYVTSSLQEGEGSFEDVEAVVLEKEIDTDSGRVDEWEVELELEGWPRPLELMEVKDEETARSEAEELASRLGVTVTERTGS